MIYEKVELVENFSSNERSIKKIVSFCEVFYFFSTPHYSHQIYLFSTFIFYHIFACFFYFLNVYLHDSPTVIKMKLMLVGMMVVVMISAINQVKGFDPDYLPYDKFDLKWRLKDSFSKKNRFQNNKTERDEEIMKARDRKKMSSFVRLGRADMYDK